MFIEMAKKLFCAIILLLMLCADTSVKTSGGGSVHDLALLKAALKNSDILKGINK